MTTFIVLLRGINIGPHNRIKMPALREALTGDGYANVRTYVQSGNVLVDTDQTEAQLRARFAARLLAQFELDLPLVIRTAEDLRSVVEADPIPEAADDPKRYVVSFIDGELSPARVQALTELAAGGERLVRLGRELYTWHPDGIARSKLASKLAAKGPGPTITARNWTTVNALLEMASAA